MKVRRWLIDIVALLVLTAAISIAFDRYGLPGTESVSITVEEGETLTSLLGRLRADSVIRYPLFFRQYMIKNGYDVLLKPGTHTMRKVMGYKAAAKELSGLVANSDSLTFTVPEGYEIYRLAEAAEDAFGIQKEVFLETADTESFDYAFLENVPQRKNRLEGYLFPDTYQFEKTAVSKDIIDKMLNRFNELWTPDLENRAKELGMSMDDIIILASLIEREAGDETEMGHIASVFYNRLAIGMPLQSCATVQYILEERKPVLSVADTKIDSPYNTYLYTGLPIGPIASPGIAAIRAALWPEDTEDYYFKVTASGKTVFSKTLKEHNAK